MLRFSICLGLCLAVFSAQAHSWYPPSCCGQNDCHPIPCEEINEPKSGVLEWNGHLFSGDKIKPSEDGKCHACIFDNGLVHHPICIFIQQTT